MIKRVIQNVYIDTEKRIEIKNKTQKIRWK